MSDTIACDSHGDSAQTYVCVHVAQSLSDGVLCGFKWSVDEDDEFQAVCDACDSMDDEEWAAQESDLIRILCFGCYRDAAALHGVTVQCPATG